LGHLSNDSMNKSQIRTIEEFLGTQHPSRAEKQVGHRLIVHLSELPVFRREVGFGHQDWWREGGGFATLPKM